MEKTELLFFESFCTSGTLQRTSRAASRPLLSQGRQSERKRHRSPGRAGGRNPLVMIVREPALKIALELQRPAFHLPGAVGQLSFQKIVDAALIGSVDSFYPRGLIQGVKGNRFLLFLSDEEPPREAWNT